MSEARPLLPSALCRRCDPGSFAFGTTADLADVEKDVVDSAEDFLPPPEGRTR